MESLSYLRKILKMENNNFLSSDILNLLNIHVFKKKRYHSQIFRRTDSISHHILIQNFLDALMLSILQNCSYSILTTWPEKILKATVLVKLLIYNCWSLYVTGRFIWGSQTWRNEILLKSLTYLFGKTHSINLFSLLLTKNTIQSCKSKKNVYFSFGRPQFLPLYTWLALCFRQTTSEKV